MNIIALDDELPALRILEHYCSETENVHLKKIFSDPKEALQYIRLFPVDVIFLDINMPTISGLDFYAKIKDDVHVVFTTAHHEFALNAFDLGALDYLLKPFSYERFLQAIRKISAIVPKQAAEKDYITLRTDYRLLRLPINEIQFIQAYDDYMKIFDVSGKITVVRSTMKSLLERLPPHEFKRIHRSYIVAVSKISSVRNKIIFTGNHEIPLGKAYESEFMTFFNKD